MSETITRNILQASRSDFTAAERRAAAVAAALEVIAGKARGADGTHLDLEFDQLSEYADKILKALES